MARSYLVLATASSAVFLLLLWQLISSFGWPQLPLSRYYSSLRTPHGVLDQVSLGDDAYEPPTIRDGSRYLLGVGKADITGFI